MNKKKGNYATISDIAKLAGTSTATVSYVLNDRPGKSLRPETVEKVLSVAEQLNYSKNTVASNLRAKKCGMVCAIIPQFYNVYYSRVCASLEESLYASGINVFFFNSHEDPRREKYLIEAAVGQRVDGIVIGPSPEGWKNTAIVRTSGIPLVSIGREFNGMDENSKSYYVSDDTFQGGYLVGKTLIKKGHRKIGFIEWSNANSSSTERREGFLKAIGECPAAELTTKSSPVLSADTGYYLTKKLLDEQKPTALFYSYHTLAYGGVLCLNDMGIAVPQDMLIAMIGTPTWASIIPSCMIVDQNEKWVGSTTGKLLAKIINEETTDPLLAEYRHICRCSLRL